GDGPAVWMILSSRKSARLRSAASWSALRSRPPVNAGMNTSRVASGVGDLFGHDSFEDEHGCARLCRATNRVQGLDALCGCPDALIVRAAVRSRLVGRFEGDLDVR